MKKDQSLRHTRGGRRMGLLWSNCSTFHKIWLELVIQLLKNSQENAMELLEEKNNFFVHGNYRLIYILDKKMEEMVFG